VAVRAKKDLYAVLGLAPTATPTMLRAAFRALVRDPDRGVYLRELVAAYEVLSDPVQREQYDRARQLRASRPSLRDTLSSPPLAAPPRLRSSRAAAPLPTPEPLRTPARERRPSMGAPIALDGPMPMPRSQEGARISSRPPHPAVTMLGTSDHGELGAHRTTYELEARLTPDEARSGTTIALNLPRGERCGRCEGGGSRSSMGCPGCHGTGLSLETRPVEVRLPSGLEDGSRLVVHLDRQGLPGTSVGVKVRIRGGLRGR
jgi:molecular chaperone DnaJ